MGQYGFVYQTQLVRYERSQRPLKRFCRLLGKIVLFPVWLIVCGLERIFRRHS